MMKWHPRMETCSYLLFLLAWLMSLSSKHSATGINIHCVGKEREALLNFKQGIQVDSCGFLTSWAGQECCDWYGIHCSNRSGHVISLDLRGTINEQGSCYLAGNVSSSLVELKHLKYLDLSFDHFEDQPIPSFIGSLHNLKYLNLSNARFGGEIPHQLANLSSLTSLDLSPYYVGSLYAKSLGWLSHLTLLRDINLSWVNLSLATDWMQVVNNLPFLSSLQLDGCSLSPSIPSSLVYTNTSTTLRLLYLAGNNFNNRRIFQWLFNFTRLSSNLEHLDLSSNGIIGPISSDIGSMWNPEILGNLCSLQDLYLRSNNITGELSTIIQTLSQSCVHKSLVSLDMANNSLWGSIPDEIGTFSSLRVLYLASNQLNGTISPFLGQLSRLEYLELENSFSEGILSQHHFSNLSRLSYLDLSDNPKLVVNISASWIPPFQLDHIDLSSCKLGPCFPKWLLTQMNVYFLDISNAEISDIIPLSFWNSLTSNIEHMNISNNKFRGILPDVSVNFDELSEIDLSSNFFTGAVPSFLRNALTLSLNDNQFSEVASFFCPKTKVRLSYLDLSTNVLSGELPNCWGYFDQLAFLRLDNNNLSGNLPGSICASPKLQALHLRNNSFSGELPMSLLNCTSLVSLDLSYNYLTGQLPHWIGNSFSGTLVILNLQSNHFIGSLPSSLCKLSKLNFLDLSSNRFVRYIPKCIYNLTAMVHSPYLPWTSTTVDIGIVDWNGSAYFTYYDAAWIMWKRKEWSFSNFLGQVKAIDISNNELEGLIPDGISSLTGMVFLNLSRNKLNGSITPKIGRLTSLESLDLSSNQLCGEIPTSLSGVSSLEILDLSNNNLSGRVPLGTQLQGFNPSSYMGNPGLCGDPLPKLCPGDQPPTNIPTENKTTHEDENEDDDIFPGLYITVVLGFIVGFWGVCGTLVIKRSWRHACFRFLGDIKDRLYVIVAVSMARAWRNT